MLDLQFFQGKNILITGHTGFKGSWLCKMLVDAGAKVTGYALPPTTTPNLFEICKVEKKMNSIVGDVRDLPHLQRTFEEIRPEFVVHMAAQPLVRESYKNPVYTYETNVMGTVNVLDCIRRTPSVKSFLNITTDKVYLNREWEWGYRENEELNGFDPYSNSKSCSELVTSCYVHSFFQNSPTAISTARAGNVIGGGDFSTDRILPDCIRAAQNGKEIAVRSPSSIRPFEHVLEALGAYLTILEGQYKDQSAAGSYNVGPNETDCLTAGELATLFCKIWNQYNDTDVRWEDHSDGGPHEAKTLRLDCSKIRQTFGWKPRWNVEKAVEKTVEWTKVYLEGGDVPACMGRQIREFSEQTPVPSFSI